MVTDIDIQVVENDVLTFHSNVLALKYAQENYGVDSIVSQFLMNAGYSPSEMRPKPGGFRLLKNVESIGAKIVIFIGVVPLYHFNYREIRDFARRTLTALAGETPDIESLALTLHGAGYGLDETEAFEAELAGLIDAISTKDYPPSLKRIIFVERNPGRCKRLQLALNDILPAIKPSEIKDKNIFINSEREKTERLRAAGYASNTKPNIFVAMPFKEDMDDIYHYGIQGAVREAGFLCERADTSVFTGDVVMWVKERISKASLVIAELTDANPNVYLEVGYAWGCEKPTVLLAKDSKNLKFDVRGQKCILYKTIKDLESSLTDELIKLSKNGYI